MRSRYTGETDAFGVQLKEKDGFLTEVSYRGYAYDADTGKYVLPSRYYDPELGRFLQEDSYWGPGNNQRDGSGRVSIQVIYQSVNLYVYCLSDPVNLTDFLGAVAGELFATIDEAVQDWGWNCFGLAEYTYFEHGSVIYSVEVDGKTYYAYTEAIYNPNDPGTVHLSADMRPQGTGFVGYIHTHPIYSDALYEYNGNSMFSDSDRNLAAKDGVPIYVLNNNPSFGFDVYRYDPYAGESTVMKAQHYYRLTASDKRRIRSGGGGYLAAWRSTRNNPNTSLSTGLRISFGITAKDLDWPNPYVWGGYYGW